MAKCHRNSRAERASTLVLDKREGAPSMAIRPPGVSAEYQHAATNWASMKVRRFGVSSRNLFFEIGEIQELIGLAA